MSNKGIYWAFVAAIISGFSVFLNKFAVGFWNNSSVYTTAKNLIAVLFLTSLILLLYNRGGLKGLNKKQWWQLVLIGLIGGSVPFLLFFKGLTLASAVNAAFIHKTLFIWVGLLAVPFFKEKFFGLQYAALGVLLTGVYLFSTPGEFKIGRGELLVFLATLMWAVENILAKRVLKDVSALAVGWGRMFFGSVFLLTYLLATGSVSQLWILDLHTLGWLFLMGVFLFAYVISWYSALKYAPATVVSSILVLAAPITAVLSSKLPIAPTFIILLGLFIFLVVGFYGRLKAFRQIRSAA